jgi:hypothetical protein
MDKTEDAKLNEFDADEWFDVARSLRPELTREEFDKAWAGFVELKRQKQLN